MLAAPDAPLNTTTLQQIIHALRRWCPLPLPAAQHDAFRQAACLSHALLFINLGSDANSLNLIEDGEDPFACLAAPSKGRDTKALAKPVANKTRKESLIRSIDLVLRNTWNEVETLRFDGDALLHCLLHYLRLVTPSRKAELPHVTVVCHSSGFNNSLKRRLHLLIRDLRHCYFESGLPACTRYVFAMSNRFYCLQFLNDQPRINCFADEAQLWIHLAAPQAERSPVVIDSFAPVSGLLKEVAQLSRDDGIHVVYRKSEGMAELAVIDEQASLFKLQCPFHSEALLLRPLHRFVRAVLERQQHQRPELQVGFGFYPVRFYRYSEVHSANPKLQPCQISTELAALPCFTLQALVRPDAKQSLGAVLYVDDREFSEAEWGESLYQHAARALLQRGEFPICCIVDLDLSLCQEQLSPRQALQLSHYLEMKSDLEAKLNRALASAADQGRLLR